MAASGSGAAVVVDAWGAFRGSPPTPATWAGVAGRGEWECRDFHAVIDAALMDVMSAHARGEASHLVVMAPSQHGKTTLVGHAFPCVWLGYFPDDRIILASYEAETAEKRGRQARDEFEEFGPAFFGLGVDPLANANSDWRVQQRTDGLVRPRRGNMISRGVGGAITGNPAELVLIDDPIKDDRDVRSKLFRDDQWEWMQNTVKRRMRRRSSLVMIYTAWHPDDVGQRMIRAAAKGEFPPVRVLRLPGVSETQEERDEWAREMGLREGDPDPMGRPPGESLWEDQYPLAWHLSDRRHNPKGFYSISQGRPTPLGGDRFDGAWVKDRLVRPRDLPADMEFCRAWDKAASTKKRSDYTASTLMARDPRGRYYVFSSRAFRLSPYERDLLIVTTAESDEGRWGKVRIHGQVDPGQAGVGDAEQFVRMLDRFWVQAERPRGDKEYRFMPFCSAAQAGNVYVVAEEDGSAPDWMAGWVTQLQQFPNGKNDDMLDTTADSYNVLAARSNACEGSDRSPTDGYEGDVAPPVYPIYRAGA